MIQRERFGFFAISKLYHWANGRFALPEWVTSSAFQQQEQPLLWTFSVNDMAIDQIGFQRPDQFLENPKLPPSLRQNSQPWKRIPLSTTVDAFACEIKPRKTDCEFLVGIH
jgi:hypothetical protein